MTWVNVHAARRVSDGVTVPVAQGTTPQVNAIMVLQPGAQGAGSVGHVALVTAVNGTTISVKQESWLYRCGQGPWTGQYLGVAPGTSYLYLPRGHAPSITRISPSAAPVYAPVTIAGTNLSGATHVTFNGTAATITSHTASQIGTVVPAHATSGNVTVTTPSGTASLPFTVLPRYFAGDVNGDGKTDLLAAGYSSTSVMLSTGTGYTAPQPWSSAAFAGTAALLAADVNGDGKADLIAVNYDPATNSGSTWVMLSTGTSFGSPQEWSGTAFNGTATILAADVNGDGKADLIAVNYDPASNTGSTWVMLSNGSGFGPPQEWASVAFAGSRATLVGDVNGDGTADLIAINDTPATNSGSTWVMLSTGMSFGPPIQWSTGPFA